MGFDVQNFGIGLLTGWGTAYGIYRMRHIISRTLQSAGEQAKGAQNYALRSTDSRYVNDLINQAERTHLAGDAIKLSEILVEPRFIPSTPLIGLGDEDDVRDVFDVVPRIHDHPFLHAQYNLDTLSVDELSAGSRALALLGQPGSGRTTALLTIAMASLNHVQFKPGIDKVQQKLDAEEAQLSEKERATKVRDRITMEQRAKERLADEKGISFDTDDDDGNSGVSLFRRLMPVYVHMADLVLKAAEYGSEVDPAEPLVRGVQYRLGRVAASTIPRNLYNRLNKGQVLLLIDGFDDLPEHERDAYTNWLRALIDQYKQNFFIVVGPATGYGKLTQLGLTPVFLRPWSDQDIQHITDRWADRWTYINRKRSRRSQPPSPEAIERARIGSRALYPVEMTLKTWASYAEDSEIPGIEGWFRSFITRLAPGDQSADGLLSQMAQLATIQLNDGFITRARMEAMAIGGTDTTSALPEATPADGKKGKKGEEEDSENTSAQGKLLGMLRRAGLLIRYKGDRYQFRHAFIAAYLTSLTLKEMGDSQLIEKAAKPGWSQAIGYAALHRSIAPVVNARLNAQPDVLYSGITEAARWLAYAETGVPWRGELLKYLGNLLTAPSQYPVVRERAAAALISTRDPNTVLIFRRAVRNTNADIRRLSCLGMGATANPETIRDLIPLMQDKEADVQLAASMALGAIRTEEAIEAMVMAFTEGSEQMRQAVAITFASIPDEGYPILAEAIEDQDMMLRRAAVFGLRRIKTTWSLIAIYRAFLEDEQWYVRSAAQQAFQELSFGREVSLTRGYVSPEGLPWLAEWASKRGEKLPAGEGANQMLLRALQEGETPIRVMAAASLGQLGLISTARPLYAALRDRQEEVRTAAHHALAEIQMMIGNALPSPA